jgi:protocatechuate 3,4-dioxygenase beta subunit
MNVILFSIAAAVLSSHLTIAGPNEPGERLVVSGRVVDSSGHGVAGVVVRAYHTDARGLYRNDNRMYGENLPPRLEGRLRTAADGSYVIETIRPAPYPNRSIPAHIHFELWPPNGGREPAILWFAGDRFLKQDDIARHPQAVCTLKRTADHVLHCTRDFHLGNEADR